MVEDGAFSLKIDYVTILRRFYSRRASKSHYWFKSYGDFAELVYFAYWWSFSGEILRLQLAQQACLKHGEL